MVLSALGIIFVLDDHVGAKINFLANIFPYNSFYMPMFVFISGYFFKEESIQNLNRYLLKKSKVFLLPYILYNLFYLFLTQLLNQNTGLNWRSNSLDFLKTCWTYGTPVDVSSATWFVIMLFHVVCLYAILRKICCRVWNDILMLILLIGVGVLATYISHNNLFQQTSILLIKVGFFMQFYQLGVCYKKYFEEILDSIINWYIITGTIVTNIVLLIIYKDGVSFSSCAFMQGFTTNNYILPLITSMTGILFWITIAKNLSLFLANDYLTNFISDNTFFIMTNHLMIYNLLNGIFMLLKSPGFEKKKFFESAWYQYQPTPEFGIIYIISTLLIIWVVKKLVYYKLR